MSAWVVHSGGMSVSNSARRVEGSRGRRVTVSGMEPAGDESRENSGARNGGLGSMVPSGRNSAPVRCSRTKDPSACSHHSWNTGRIVARRASASSGVVQFWLAMYCTVPPPGIGVRWALSARARRTSAADGAVAASAGLASE